MIFIEDADTRSVDERLRDLEIIFQNKNIDLLNWCEHISTFTTALFLADKCEIADGVTFLQNAFSNLSDSNKKEIKTILETFNEDIATEAVYNKTENVVDALYSLMALFSYDDHLYLPQEIINKTLELYKKHFEPTVITT